MEWLLGRDTKDQIDSMLLGPWQSSSTAFSGQQGAVRDTLREAMTVPVTEPAPMRVQRRRVVDPDVTDSSTELADGSRIQHFLNFSNTSRPEQLLHNDDDDAVLYMPRRKMPADDFHRAPGPSLFVQNPQKLRAGSPAKVPLMSGLAFGSGGVDSLGLGRPASSFAGEVQGATNLVEEIHRHTGVPIAILEALHKDGVLQKVPRNDQGEISSIGSILHASNTCSPCLFWFRKSCSKSIQCGYCHFRHAGQKNKRIRPSRKARLQMRAYKNDGADDDDTDGDTDNEEMKA